VSDKRKYTKRSNYWDKFKSDERSIEDMIKFQTLAQSVAPATAGEPIYTETSSASRRTHHSSSTGGRSNSIYNSSKNHKYTNIKNGLLPYEYAKDGTNIREAIELCQKAYANVAIFRNAVDIMAEFSNSNIYLEGENDKSKKFVEKWFEKIQIWKLKDQFFREYYRSGNIFLYRLDGKFSSDDFAKLNYVYGSGSLKPGEIPIKYTLLNPYDIVIESATAFNNGIYKKVLSDYELERLRSPKTDDDKQVLKSLPPEVRKKIKEGQFNRDGLSMELKPEKLVYSFYKKQDYEPFAVPFGFPVLDDINWKMELKKIDQAIVRTVENVILLITMGAEPEKGGVNPNNLQAMQELFKNESVGRALIADYTTKAEFVIPDLKKVIGSEKYQIVNEDIREGLQNVIVGNEKFANTQIKAEIFLERLKESRNAFLNDFLQPQIKMVCKNMGFRTYPRAKFEEIDIKDEVQFQRVITRLLEIGIITPEQGIESMKTGLYPSSKMLNSSQEAYIKQREKGHYNPLVGGIPLVESAESQEGTRIQEEQLKLQEKQMNQQAVQNKLANKNKPGPSNTQNKTPKSAGRPSGATAEMYDRKSIQSTVYDIESLQVFAVDKFKAIKKLKTLNKNQKDLISTLCESIVCSSEKKTWKSKINSCIKNPDKIEALNSLSEVLSIAADHELGDYPSAILYHSKKHRGK